jgi:hypothetical protein
MKMAGTMYLKEIRKEVNRRQNSFQFQWEIDLSVLNEVVDEVQSRKAGKNLNVNAVKKESKLIVLVAIFQHAQ